MRLRDPLLVLAAFALFGASTSVCCAEVTAGAPGSVYTIAVSGTT